MLKETVLKNRSYRRFYEEVKIDSETLKGFIELARITPSAANRQPLKYILSNTEEKNAKIFETLAWAGYLKDWDGPEPGERPSAYIIVLGDTDIAKDFSVDPGIVMQTILLGAVEKGLGGCMFGSIKRSLLAESLAIPERYQVLYVVALGKPNEKVIIEEISEGDIKYWRDTNSKHHVPKRSVDEIILSES
ncbi:MAG: nitroreductase family protein [Spirochaetia bacterium]|jgi:nitroreductase|nr:nitroreductase family protein [Spirochaetia bacterium]